MVPAATAFIIGIFNHRTLPIQPVLYLLASALLLIAAAAMFRRIWLSTSCLLIDLFLAGLILGQLQVFYYPRRHIGEFASNAPALVQVEARILDPPPTPTPDRKSTRLNSSH